MLKKFTLLSLMLFIALIFTSACGSGGSGSCDFFGYPTTAETKTITLSKYKFTLDVGTTDKVIAYVNGIDKTKEVKYTPIKEEFTKDTVATVEKGLITALKAGTSIVQVSYTGAESVTFTVTANDPNLPTLEVVKNEINLEFGTDPSDIESIIVTLNGKDVTSEATFISTDENVATVDENGQITIVGEGETQIVIHVDGANDQVVTIKVTLPELDINKSNINLQVGQTEQLTVKLKDEDKTKNAIYQSSDPNIATVDENGLITAVGEGTAIITVAVEGAKNAQVTVNVYDPENHKIKCKAGTNMYETEDGFVMYKGETGNITVLIGGVDKTADGVYTPEDETIVKVDNQNEHGKMYALEIGTTSINLHHEEALEGDVKVNVIVKPKPTIQTNNMLIGNTQQIIFNGNAENWTFTSDNNDIASVDSTGKITSKGVSSTGTGTTIIHAYDGIKTHDFTINTYRTLDNNQNGVSSTLLIDEERQQMLTILMDTGMISNENDIQDIVQIDDNGMTEIKITIDRADGQKVAVVVYKDGTVKYISTETVQGGEVTVNIASSPQNTVAEENTSGRLKTIVTPGFYNANDELIASWELVTGDKIDGGSLVFNNGVKQTVSKSKNINGVEETVWGWDYTSDFTFDRIPSYPKHMYNILNSHPTLRNTMKIVMPEGITKLGGCILSCRNGGSFTTNHLNFETIVFPNTFTQDSLVSPLWDSEIKSITNYTIRSDNPNFDSIDGVIYTEANSDGINETLISPPMNKTKIRVLDGTKNINGCMYNQSRSAGPIGSGADIEMPNSIVYASFSWMDNLKWVEFTEGTQRINIDDCSNCTSVFLPKTITTIPKGYNDYTRQWSTPFWYSINIVFYVEPGVNTSGWCDIWNSARENGTYMRPVNWNITREDYEANYRPNN